MTVNGSHRKSVSCIMLEIVTLVVFVETKGFFNRRGDVSLTGASVPEYRK